MKTGNDFTKFISNERWKLKNRAFIKCTYEFLASQINHRAQAIVAYRHITICSSPTNTLIHLFPKLYGFVGVKTLSIRWVYTTHAQQKGNGERDVPKCTWSLVEGHKKTKMVSFFITWWIANSLVSFCLQQLDYSSGSKAFKHPGICHKHIFNKLRFCYPSPHLALIWIRLWGKEKNMVLWKLLILDLPEFIKLHWSPCMKMGYNVLKFSILNSLCIYNYFSEVMII